MYRLLAAAVICLLVPSLGQGEDFDPGETTISQHRATVYKLARDYIVDTFNLTVIEEGTFNPVRFNSLGVWGDFDVRLKELGGDRYEVQGWVLPTGQGGKPKIWHVIVKYPMEDPEAWRTRRVDRDYANDPEFLGWRYGGHRSVPYLATYTKEFEHSIISR